MHNVFVFAVQTHVSAAVAQNDRPECRQRIHPVAKGYVNYLGKHDGRHVDVQKSAACRNAPLEPCMWPAGFLDAAFPDPFGSPTSVGHTQADLELIRQHVDDTVLPWRYATAPNVQRIQIELTLLCISSTLT